MSGEPTERPLRELELLRAPARDDSQRHALRARIASRAEALLAARARARSHWEVLAAWARPGLVAAVLATILVAGALQTWSSGQRPIAPLALDDMLSGAGQTDRVPALLVASREPDADAVVAAALLSNGNALTREPPESDTRTDPTRDDER